MGGWVGGWVDVCPHALPLPTQSPNPPISRVLAAASLLLNTPQPPSHLPAGARRVYGDAAGGDGVDGQWRQGGGGDAAAPVGHHRLVAGPAELPAGGVGRWWWLGWVGKGWGGWKARARVGYVVHRSRGGGAVPNSAEEAHAAARPRTLPVQRVLHLLIKHSCTQRCMRCMLPWRALWRRAR